MSKINEPIPLYGTIPYFGGEWTVSFKKERSGHAWRTNELSGCGDFPFDRFLGIPVVDYRRNDAVMDVLEWNVSVEEASTAGKCVPLKNWLARIHDLGITIHNYER